MPQIFELFQYDFFVRAFVAVVFMGAALPMLGILLILRRLSLFADTMSHIALAGVSVATLFSLAPIYVSMTTAVAASSALEELRLRNRLPGDAILALLLYSSLAFTLITFSIRSSTIGLTNFLFGNIFAISTGDMVLLVVVMAIVILFTMSTISEISQMALSDELAKANGVKLNLLNRLLAVLTGAAVVVAMFAVGVLLVGALIVVPALVALRRAKGTLQALLMAGILGLLSSVGGFILSYYLDWPVSGSLVLVGVAILVISELELFVRQKLLEYWFRRGLQSNG